VQTSTQESILIAAASTTSELSEVRKIAREMSLGVMNAKAISCRAGDIARGFQPITDFIDEMAHDVMRLVEKISYEATHLSRLAVKHNHSQSMLQRFRQVENRTQNINNASSLKPAVKNLIINTNNYQRQFLENVRILRSLLDDISRSTRGAQVISTSSRVEASRAGDYRESLEIVADQLEQATDKIRQRIKNSLSRLANVVDTLT
jgi:Mg2+ and Co2+ transporter CorA